MWVLVIVVVIVSAVIVAAVSSASDNIVEGLHRMPRPNDDDIISKYDLEELRIVLTDIKELLSISCPQCGDKPWYGLTVAEQRVWLEEHFAEHKSGKLGKRALDDIAAERHEREREHREREHKEFEASHKHLFSPEEEKEEKRGE
ncbi:MAG: hypothetical protein ABSF45_27625 [Terriglobia bacterium]|jgi:hypothetical protein